MVRTLFCGTNEFAATVLEQLISSNAVDIVGVVTQPDRPTGRGNKLTPPPVKQVARTSVFQPENLSNEAEEILSQTKPELIIVVAYGQFIPKVMLDYPKYKALNIHGSVLPKLRGAVPIQAAILNGFDTTGVSIQVMAEKMDAGPVVAAREIEIAANDSTKELSEKLSLLASGLLIETLPKWVNGELEAKPQDEKQASYCYIKDMAPARGEIKHDLSVELAARVVRAFNPNPVAFFPYEFQGKQIAVKIFEAKINKEIAPPANSLQLNRFGKSLFLGLCDGWLELLEIQIPGKKRMSGKDYLFLV